MVVTYDLYKELELERAWDEKTIKSTLKEMTLDKKTKCM